MPVALERVIPDTARVQTLALFRCPVPRIFVRSLDLLLVR